MIASRIQRGSLAILLALLGSLSGARADSGGLGESVNCDVVVTEASLGGVAAAIQSAQMGVKTCLTSMTDWLGGQISSQGVSPVDTPGHPSVNGWAQFLIKKDATHSMSLLLDRIAVDNPAGAYGKNWVSEYSFTPADADKGIKEVIAPLISSGVLQVFYETAPKSVQKNANGTIVSVDYVRRHYTGNGPKPYEVFLSQEIQDWYDRKSSSRYVKTPLRLSGKIFIDATDTGELLVLSGAQYQVGYVSRWGRKGNKPKCVSAFTFPALIAQGKPSAQDIRWLSQSLSQLAGVASPVPPIAAIKLNIPELFMYRRICGPTEDCSHPSTSIWNWSGVFGNDYSARSLLLTGGEIQPQLLDWQGGMDLLALREAEFLSLNAVQSLQAYAEAVQDRGIQLIWDPTHPLNTFGTGTGLSKFPYIRESRRMVGFKGFQLKVVDIYEAPGATGLAQFTHFSDTVGIGQYDFDMRHCSDPTYRASYGGYSKLAQIPLRALVSENIPNLLAGAKDLAVDKEAETAYREHPTEWNIGIGAGSAAAVAVRNGINTQQLLQAPDRITDVQKAVVGIGNGRVVWGTNALPGAPACVPDSPPSNSVCCNLETVPPDFCQPPLTLGNTGKVCSNGILWGCQHAGTVNGLSLENPEKASKIER